MSDQVGLTVLHNVPPAEPTSPEEAAEILFDDPPGPSSSTDPHMNRRPDAPSIASGNCLTSYPVLSASLSRDGARAGAEILSEDRFQGSAEIIQNADYAGARTVVASRAL